MSKLERWLPFKFRRKSDSEKKADPAGAPQPSAETLSQRVPQAHSPLTPFFGAPMDKLFQSMFSDPFFRDPFSRLAELDRWFGDFSPARFQPTVDVVDEETCVGVTAELPGMSKDDIKLQIENDVLFIRGEKKNESQKTEQGVFRGERYYGYFQRAVPLPSDVDHDKAEAEFDKGVLVVRLPKVPGGDKAKTVAVKG